MRIKLILIGIIGVLFVGLAISIQNAKNNARKYKISAANEKSYKDSIRVYIGKNGREIYEKMVLQKTAQDLKRSLDKKDIEMRQLMRERHIKPNEVDAIISVGTRVDTIVKLKRFLVDTCYSFKINPQFTANFCVTKDSVSCHPVVENSMNLIMAHNRETIKPRRSFFLWRLFQAKHTVVKVVVTNSNKAIKVNDINATYIIDK